MIRNTHVVTWKRTPAGWQAEQRHVSYLSADPFVMEVVDKPEKLREERRCVHLTTFAADCPRCLWGDR